MRTAVLIAAAAAALTLTACNRTDDAAATDASTEASTEAAEASGAAMDTAATTGAGGTGGGANAAGGAGSASGETMDPATGGTVNDGSMAPVAQPGDTAGNNVTETERRLNPPAPQ